MAVGSIAIDPENHNTIYVGTGTAVSLSTTSLNFGSQKVGTTGGPLPVTLTDKGTTALSITNIGITGRNAGDFAETNNCGTLLGVGKACTINLTFTPHAKGSRSASLSITDNGGGSPHTVTMSGTGTLEQSASCQGGTVAARP